jgi:hypothetical protein
VARPARNECPENFCRRSASERSPRTLLGDLPDLARLEDAGLLGKAPLPEELRGALGIRGDAEDGAEIDAEEDGDVPEDYVEVGLAEE